MPALSPSSLPPLPGAAPRLLLSLILGACALPAVQAQPAAPAPAAHAVDLSLPALPLQDALLRLGQASATTIIGDPQLTAGRQSPAMRLRGSVGESLRQLLQGSGLQALPNANGEGYRLERAPQQANAVSALPTVTVTSQPDDVGILALRSSTGTKTNTSLLETAQSVSVVNREMMDMIGAKNTAEALRYSAGVTVGGYGVDSRVDEISLRGFRTGSFANNLYLDGLRPPGSSSGATASATQFDGYGLERIDVLRGPSSVLYGQIAPGGLINATSKRPTDYRRGEIGVGTDNYGLARLNADLSGPLDDAGEWLYRVVGTAYHTDTQVDDVELNRVMFAPSLTWRPSNRTSVTLLANYQRDHGGSTYQFLPAHGTYFATQYGTFGTNRLLGEPGFSSYERTQASVGYQLSHQVTDRIKLGQNLRYMTVDTDTSSVARQGDLLADNRTLRRTASLNAIRSDGFTIDNNAQMDVELGETAHTLLAGLDYRTQTIRVQQASGTVGSLDVFNPVYGSPVRVGALAPTRRSDSNQTGLYAQDQIAWRRWTATVGLRHDWSQDNALVRTTGVKTRYDDEATTWRTGLTYQFDNGIAPYASYATSFEPVNGAGFNDVPFKPTEGKQAEVGVKYQPPGSRSMVMLSAYEIRQQNITTPDPDPFHLCNGAQCQIQTGEGRVRGLELEGNLALTDELTLVASATLMDSEVTKSNGADLGKALPRVPRQSYNAWLDYRFPASIASGLSVGAGLRHTSSSYGDSANTYPSGSLTLIDAALRYDMGAVNPAWKGLKLSLNASNLADKVYLASCSGIASCYYGARRTIMANLNYAW